MRERLVVLLTAIGGGGHGEQILKALRLAKHRYVIIGTDVSPSPANRDLVDEFHQVPRAADPCYLDMIEALARSKGAIALFHGSEAEMSVFSAHKTRLEAAGLYVPVNPPSVLAICQDKSSTVTFLQKQGFLTPVFRAVARLEDLEGFDALPAVIKPSIGGGGSSNVFIAQSAGELRAFAAYLLSVCPRLVVQEYVGSPDAEFTVGVLFGRDGVLINSIGVKRVIDNALSTRISIPNRSGRRELGERLVISSGVSQGFVGRWPEVTSQCEKIAAALRPVAPINIQCRVISGRVVPFEINPRFSGTTSIRAMADYNEPDVLIRRDVLGEKIATGFGYREILIMRTLAERELESTDQAAPKAVAKEANL